MSEPRSLTVLSEGTRMLAEARTLDDLLQVRDLAMAAAAYARVHRLGREAQAYATEIAAVASRRMAELDPPTQGARTDLSGSADKLPVPKQRRSENRDLLAFSEAELRAQVQAIKDPSLSRVRRLARDRKASVRPKPAPPAQPPGCDIRLGDFRTVLTDVPDGSVDVILTDPPYPAEYLPLWSDLGLFAKRVLRPDGLLVAMSGQLHLPAVLAALGEHLRYRWTMAYLTKGRATVVHPAAVTTMWKPLVVYGSRTRRLYDVVDAGPKNETDKADHEWGQSVSGFADLLRLVADPGQIVCDPFLGAGTTALVAMRHGCSFIGAEIDPDHHATSLRRVAA